MPAAVAGRSGSRYMSMFYAYVLRSMTNPTECYRGSTHDHRRRLAEHNAGKCRHTSKFRPWRLIFYAAFETAEFARGFEAYLKTESGHAVEKRHLGIGPELPSG